MTHKLLLEYNTKTKLWYITTKEGVFNNKSDELVKKIISNHMDKMKKMKDENL